MFIWRINLSRTLVSFLNQKETRRKVRYRVIHISPVHKLFSAISVCISTSSNRDTGKLIEDYHYKVEKLPEYNQFGLRLRLVIGLIYNDFILSIGSREETDQKILSLCIPDKDIFFTTTLFQISTQSQINMQFPSFRKDSLPNNTLNFQTRGAIISGFWKTASVSHR